MILSQKSSLKGIIRTVLTISLLISASLWAAEPGTEVDNYGRAITVDQDGNVYISGYHSGVTYFGDVMLDCGRNKAIFLSKLDTNGNWLWTKEFPGIGIDEGRNLTIDSKGNLYFTGWFENETVFDEHKLISRGSKDAFIAKLDQDGNIIWIRQAGSTGDDRGVDVDVTDDGLVYLAGWFGGKVKFGDDEISAYGGQDMYVAALDEDGNWLWANNPGGIDMDIPLGISVDNEGNCLVCGRFTDNYYFVDYDTKLEKHDTLEDRKRKIKELKGYGTTDMILFKIGPDGNYKWFLNAGGVSEDVGRSVHVDSDDNCYFTGWFSDMARFGPFEFQSKGDRDIFVAKVDKDGEWQWVTVAGAQVMDAAIGIKAVPSGHVYITGNFGRTVKFGDETLEADQFEDVFVSKLDFDGNWIWTRSISNVIRGSGITVATDDDENCYIVGYAGFRMFNKDINSYWDAVNEDILVAKIDKDGVWQWVRRAGCIKDEDAKEVIGNPLLTPNFNPQK